jgi:hypothetical protein
MLIRKNGKVLFDGRAENEKAKGKDLKEKPDTLYNVEPPRRRGLTD